VANVAANWVRLPFSCLSFGDLHNPFSVADRCDALRLERRFLIALNRVHPVGEIGDLFVGRLSLEQRLHASKPRSFCAGKRTTSFCVNRNAAIDPACQADLISTRIELESLIVGRLPIFGSSISSGGCGFNLIETLLMADLGQRTAASHGRRTLAYCCRRWLRVARCVRKHTGSA
jgi:hypothetical protein